MLTLPIVKLGSQLTNLITDCSGLIQVCFELNDKQSWLILYFLCLNKISSLTKVGKIPDFFLLFIFDVFHYSVNRWMKRHSGCYNCNDDISNNKWSGTNMRFSPSPACQWLTALQYIALSLFLSSARIIDNAVRTEN